MSDSADPPSFGTLLTLLDPDPVRAEELYVDLSSQLRRFAEWRGCDSPDDVAQEALVRGFRRITYGAKVESVRAYFFGVLKLVLCEQWKPGREQLLSAEDWVKQPAATRDFFAVDARLQLQQVLATLEEDERSLIVRYHTEDRTELSQELGITRSTLRLRIHRIKRKIEQLATGVPAV